MSYHRTNVYNSYLMIRNRYCLKVRIEYLMSYFMIRWRGCCSVAYIISGALTSRNNQIFYQTVDPNIQYIHRYAASSVITSSPCRSNKRIKRSGCHLPCMIRDRPTGIWNICLWIAYLWFNVESMLSYMHLEFYSLHTVVPVITDILSLIIQFRRQQWWCHHLQKLGNQYWEIMTSVSPNLYPVAKIQAGRVGERQGMGYSCSV